MGYDDQISRAVTSALVPEVVTGVFASAIEESAVLTMVPDAQRMQMPHDDVRMPIFSSDVAASWVSGDTGLKQTTAAEWTNKHLIAEELAAIVVIPDRVSRDSSINLDDWLIPRIGAAIGKAFDLAVLFGINAPTAFPDDIYLSTQNASQSISDELGDDLYDAIMGVDGVLAKVEEDGFYATGHIAALSMRAKLRALRSSDGFPLFQPDIQTPGQYMLDGQPVRFPRNGVFEAAAAAFGNNPLMISGDWSQLVIGIRSGLEVTVASEGVITDVAGNVVINLFQQDAKAIRVVFVAGWQVPNPTNAINATEATRYPFASLYDGA